jgi:hypothetical protein
MDSAGSGSIGLDDDACTSAGKAARRSEEMCSTIVLLCFLDFEPALAPGVVDAMVVHGGIVGDEVVGVRMDGGWGRGGCFPSLSQL